MILLASLLALQSDWSPAAISADKLCQRADSEISRLHGVYCEAGMTFSLPTGKGLTQEPLTAYLESSKRFALLYIVFPDGKPHTGVLRCNGQRRYRSEGFPSKAQASDPKKPVKLQQAPVNGITTAASAHDFAPSAKQLYANWAFMQPRAVFAGLTDAYPTFTRLVAGARAAKAKVLVLQAVTKTSKGTNHPFYRLVITPAKGRTIDIFFDGQIFLPTQCSTYDGGKFAVDWKGSWFNHKVFQDKEFQVAR